MNNRRKRVKEDIPCTTCGAMFSPTTYQVNRNIWLCKSCRKKLWYEHTNEGRPKMLPYVICKVCGEAYAPTKHQVKYNTGCNECEKIRYAEKVKKRMERNIPYKICSLCGSAYAPTRRNIRKCVIVCNRCRYEIELNNPDTLLKRKSVSRLNHAIRRGKIQRQPCVICGARNAHGHHKDYTKPLEVKWLCAQHHKELHVRLKAANIF